MLLRRGEEDAQNKHLQTDPGWPRPWRAGEESGRWPRADAWGGDCVRVSPRGSREDSHQGSVGNVFMCKLFLLLTHVLVPGNYRVKGIKKDIIPPHQSSTGLHLYLTLAARHSAFTGATLISVT